MHPVVAALLTAAPLGVAVTYGALTWVNLRCLAFLRRGVERLTAPRDRVLRDLLDAEVHWVRRQALRHPLRTAWRLSGWRRPGEQFYLESLAERGAIDFDDPVDGTRRDCDLLDALEAHDLQKVWPQRRVRGWR